MNRSKALAFRVVTGLFVLAMLPGAVMNLVQPDVAVDMASTLGIPLSMLTLLGIWKLLGVAAIVTPLARGRLREWAYAGFFFDLTGAIFLHLAAGDANIAAPAAFVVLLVVSYRLQPTSATTTPSRLTSQVA